MTYIHIPRNLSFDYGRPGSHDVILERKVLPCIDHVMNRTVSLGGKEASDLQTPSKQESVLDYVFRQKDADSFNS